VNKTPLLVLTGPTGAGKSVVAVGVAESLGAEIICADSRQLYRGLEIGSAAPPPALLKRVPHHLYGALDPAEPVSAGTWRDMAEKAAREIASRGRIPFLVGGTGLYIQAMAGTLSLAPPANPAIVELLSARAKSEGTEALWHELEKADPAAAAAISPGDSFRIVRALALVTEKGRPLAELRGSREVPWSPVARAGLGLPREALYSRINFRTDEMLNHGMLDEARLLRERALSQALPSLRAIGYRHLFAALEGRMGVEEAAELIKRDSRRYAKRQMTWFRGREADLRWFRGENAPAAVTAISRYFQDVLG